MRRNQSSGRDCLARLKTCYNDCPPAAASKELDAVFESVPIPSSARRGGCRINKISRSHHSAADGWSDRLPRLALPTTPAAPVRRLRGILLMSRPPLLVEEGIHPT